MPSPSQPATTETDEEFFRAFHQHQGATTHCADFSISMACHIYRKKKGLAADCCAVEKITEFLDRFFFLGFRFPAKEGLTQGGATPGGVAAALLMLGIPFLFTPFGTLGGLEQSLRDGKMIIVSQGKIMDPTAGTWGHVMLIVGMGENIFLLLNPADREGVSRRDKRAFLNDWWYPPFHPCWVIG